MVVHLVIGSLFITSIDFSSAARPATDEEPREEQLPVAQEPRSGAVPQGDRAEQRAEGVRDDIHESKVLSQLRRHAVDTQRRPALQRAAHRGHEEAREDGQAHPADGRAAAVH